MKCPKCGNETSKVKISFFVRGNACSCGWCDFADKIKAKPSLFSRLSSIFRTYKISSYKWKFLKFRLGVPRLVSKHFAKLPLYTEEEPIEISSSTRPKEVRKEEPLYKIRKRGWKEKRKSFKLGGSPPMNKRIKVQYLPIPMPKFMASAILTLFMIILAGGYQYVHTIYPFIPSIPFLFFLNKPKEKCALKGCDNPVSEDSPFSIVKGRTLRFCSQSHANIYSDSSHLEEYERIQKMYGRRDLLKGIALAGLGAGVAGLLSGMKISEAAVDTTKPAVVSQFSQIGDASFVVFQDKNGNSYVVDKGVGPQLGELIVKANVITPYGASLRVGAAGAQTQTAGIQEAINALPNGGEIFIKNGTYTITSTIILNKSNIALIGESYGLVKITVPNNTNKPLLVDLADYTGAVSGNAVYNNLIKNIIFDANGNNQTGSNAGGGNTTVQATVELANSPGCIIENCQFLNAFDGGLSFTNLGGQTPNFPNVGIIIKNIVCNGENPTQTGDLMQLNGVIDSYVENVLIQNSTASTLTAGFLQRTTLKKIKIRPNTGSVGRGLSLEPPTANSVSDVEINQLDVYGLNGHQVFMGGAVKPQRIKFSQCRSYNSGLGGNAGYIGACDFLTMVDCDAFGNTGSGFLFSGTNIKLIGCKAWNNSIGFAFDNTVTGITTNVMNDINLENCSAFDNQSTPTQTFALNVNSESGGIINVVWRGGYVGVEKNGVYSITGTGTSNVLIKDVQGFNPQGFSITTPTMPPSGTAQTNTSPFPVIVYLYGGTVTQITINGQVVFSSGTGVSLTGQSFTLNPRDTIAITYSVAPTWKWYGL